MNPVYIVDGVRSPIAKIKRGLRQDGKVNSSSIDSLSPLELARQPLVKLFERTGIAPHECQIFRMGSAISKKCEPELFHAPAKHVIRNTVPGGNLAITAVTLDEACSTGLVAIEDAVKEIRIGYADLAIAGGVDMMSRHPDEDVVRSVTDYESGKSMAVLSDTTAVREGITRDEYDQYTYESYQFAKAHLHDHEERMIPIVGPDGAPLLIIDEEVNRTISLEKIAGYPLFDKPYPTKITAPIHCSKYGDASAFVMLASERVVISRNLTPCARILGFGSHSEKTAGEFILAPDTAIMKALAEAGIPLSKIDFFEINEAFPGSPLSVMQKRGLPREIVNPWGGAIAHGHPIGATGAVLLVKAITILEKNNMRYAVVSLCSAISEAIAVVIERI